jgi:NADPH-dependent curcumin reductase CurA
MSLVSREVRLARRPIGMPQDKDFEIVPITLGAPKAGEILVRNHYMSVDPYMRGRMVDRESYVPPFQIGEALQGGAVGEVIEAGDGAPFAKGDFVQSMWGWREAWVGGTAGVTKVDPKLAPVQAFLGALGMPGLTAYAGLLDVGALKDGETVFVSAAAGAVGSIVCQIAKAKGCYVVGSAGSDAKCEWLLKEAGCDKVINYKTADLEKAVAEAFPKGIDVYFENVGGAHLIAAINNLKVKGRVAMCGMIEQYNATEMPAGPGNIIMAIPKRLRIEGFVVSDYFHRLGDFYRDMGTWAAQGKMKWKETTYDGIDNAVAAFLGLFKGENFGKALVKLA